MQPKPTVQGLPVYQPGKPIDEVKREYGLQHVIKLASNENPFGCSPYVLEHLLPSAKEAALYPDGAARELREQMARHLGIEEGQLLFGNGSDELVQLISRCYLQPGTNAVMADVTFPRYETNCRIEGADVIKVPLKDGTHDLDAMAQAVNDETKVVWLCNPNNPTGTMVTHDDVVQFLDQIPSSALVVMDEAYVEYVTDDRFPDSLSLLSEYPNLIILRTFSKIYGLASLRVGYGIASPDILTELNRVREPFNVNALAQRAGVLALEDQSFVQDCRTKNTSGIEQLTSAFDRLNMRYFPSQANFVFVQTGVPSEEVFQHLLEQGIIVRHDTSWGFPTGIRVTIGSQEENAAFIQALEQFIQKRGRERVL
ncbi:histidinol-phosphate transaminase [Novibacillus thermophilus]|uniref:Histidinol-phosphate aminotransferase n=1 Tax=Novibacillus thermophilus TaxID=1471761 RepID=A0A1U9K9G4_9BACL|nr:histidinol-phosphate transaminase [Novibacillus thermophilus]AQS56709.1 histidinol-phosphate transaminase [Novibacillus thermophilus]